MAQLAPIAAVVGAGVSTYATIRQAQTQSAMAKQSAENARAQEAARTQQSATLHAADSRARDARLAGTIASARARLAAGGISPDEGSGAALVAGLHRDAAAAEADSEAMSTARLAAGRRSLLNPDGSLTTWLRAGASFGNSMRSLLD
jgi:hypothetical protein